MKWMRSPLEIPEEFPALPYRPEHERRLLAWRYPSFDAHSSWSIFETRKSGEFIVRRLEYDPRDQARETLSTPDIYGAESPLPAKTATSILSAFESLQIPTFRRPPVSIVLDGIQCGVQFGSSLQGTRLHWWMESSEEWAPLIRLFEQTVETLEHALPGSTLRVYGR
jgi:hypothetical protein